MEPIKPSGGAANKPKTVGEAIERSNSVKKKITRGILNSTGIFVGVFIIFVVIVVFTTDIQLTSALQWAELGLAFFVLLMCSYSMYVNCADSGTRAGRQSDTFLSSNEKYDALKAEIVEKKIQGRLPEFCRWYIEEELWNTRASMLTEVGITLGYYKKHFVGVDNETLKKNDKLSKAQIDAIIAANKIKPIRLTPEMILKRGRGSSHRSPLGMNPKTKKGINFAVKFVKICLTSVLMSVIVLDVIVTPTWATFAACLLKLFPVVLNGFFGYKMGYENIVIDTVNYMTDQSDLMQQFVHYVEQTPAPEMEAADEPENTTITEETSPLEKAETGAPEEAKEWS